MNKGKIIAGVTAVMIGSVSPDFFADMGTVVHAEKLYDVKLSVETVEIDINDIPDDRVVQVGVSVDGNPGFLSWGFFIEFDSRLSTPEHRLSEFDMDKLYINYGFRGTGNLIEMAFASTDFNNLFYDNGVFVKLNYIIPEDACPGDFYSLSPFLEYSEPNYHSKAFFRQENSFDNLFDMENFAEPVGGGIRITGKQEAETQAPAPEPSVLPSPEQQQQEEQPAQVPSSENSVNDKKSETQVTTAAVSETVLTSLTSSETVTTSESSALTTPEITTVSETEISTVRETTCGETFVSEAAVIPEKKNNIKLQPFLWSLAGALIGVIAYRIVKSKKENNSGR